MQAKIKEQGNGGIHRRQVLLLTVVTGPQSSCLEEFMRAPNVLSRFLWKDRKWTIILDLAT